MILTLAGKLLTTAQSRKLKTLTSAHRKAVVSVIVGRLKAENKARVRSSA